jgi:hypothetical protein
MGESVLAIAARFKLKSHAPLEEVIREALIRPSADTRSMAGAEGLRLDLTDVPYAESRIQPQVIADLYEIPLVIVTHVIRDNSRGRSSNDNLRMLAECYAIIYNTLSSDRIATRIWLNRSNRALYGSQPIELVERGRLDKFRALVVRAANGGYD